MSVKRLYIWIAVWVFLCLLAASPLGAMLGFFAAFAVAMYGGLAGVVMQASAGLLGWSLDWTQTGRILGYVTVVAFCLGILVILWGAWRDWAAGLGDAARLRLVRVVHLIGAAAALLLSARSLEKAWPM